MRNRFKSASKIFNSREGGMVLPLVLIALLLMALLIPPLFGLIGTTLVTGQTYENNSYELYAADAGVMDAIWRIQGYADPELNYISDEGVQALFFKDGVEGPCEYVLQDDDLNGKTVTVKIVRDGLGFIITSTATDADGSNTTIETRVQFPPPPPPIMMAAGALNGILKINADIGTADSWVSVYANGDIELIGSGEVYGNAYYTYPHGLKDPIPDTFYGQPIETVELELVEGVLPVNPEVLSLEYPQLKHAGNLDISALDGFEQELGPIYIDGNLTISDSVYVELKGTVWVKGQIQINDTAVVNGAYDENDAPDWLFPADKDLLYSKYETGNPYFIISDYSGNGRAMSINGSTPSDYDYKVVACLYAPDGYIYVGGNAGVDGAVVGEEVTIIGASRLTFPLPFEPVFPEYRSMDIDYWKIT